MQKKEEEEKKQADHLVDEKLVSGVSPSFLRGPQKPTQDERTQREKSMDLMIVDSYVWRPWIAEAESWLRSCERIPAAEKATLTDVVEILVQLFAKKST